MRSAQYDVLYMRPSFFPEGIMGVRWITEKGLLPVKIVPLTETHVYLRTVTARNPSGVYLHQQGENWSPKGEARPLIESLAPSSRASGSSTPRCPSGTS
jgi:hypothetical protein